MNEYSGFDVSLKKIAVLTRRDGRCIGGASSSRICNASALIHNHVPAPKQVVLETSSLLTSFSIRWCRLQG